jgi:hypothetical protein
MTNTNEEKIRHWLQIAQVAAEVMEFCMAQVAHELKPQILDGAVVAEVEEPPTAPIRPPLG